MKNLRALTAYEDQECYWLVEYLDILINQKKVLQYTHIPNETYTKSWAAKRKNKKMGVNKGFPDYVILLKNGVLFLEMKRERLGRASAEQEAWINDLQQLGQDAYVCNGFEEAKVVIEAMLAKG